MGTQERETVTVHFILLLALLTLLNSTALAEIRTLSEFYSHLDQAASTLKAQADLEAQRSNLLAQEALKGLEVFGGVSGGFQKSPFAREPFGHFFDPLARIGVRYPLLGSAERQQRAIEDAATQVRIETIRLDWSRRLAALFLEENYAAYWSAQKILSLTDVYLHLRNDGVENLLRKRQEAGLLFKSDYFEFLSAFERAQRTQVEFYNNSNQALMRLAHLTNSAVTPFTPVKPSLGKIANTVLNEVDQLDLKILQAQIDNLQNIRDTQNWQGIESDVSVTGFGGPAIPHPSPPEGMQWGYGGAVGFNFRMPLEIVSYRKNEQSRLNSQLISLRADYTRRDQELQHDFHSLLSSFQQLAQQINFQRTRLEAAQELMRERHLRLQVLDGDVIEQYLQALNNYYRIAAENIEAESEHWKLHIRLRQFILLPNMPGEDSYPETDLTTLLDPLHQAKQFLINGGKEASEKTIKHATPANTEFLSGQLAVYVWNFDKLITQTGLWKKKETNAINRFLVSLDAQQISQMAENPKSLQNFLHDARHHKKKIELLLGDPDWILPEYRNNLLQIIHKLAGVGFDGLHLDIEPDQLESELSGKARLEEFVETVRQVAAISPWTVGISIHPRYLAKDSSFGLCLLCELSRIGIKEIAVMYYSMNIQSIVTMLKSAMQQHPTLVFSLAQSLELEIGPENSYAHKSRRNFINAMQQLQNQLQSSNFGGLIIQSWLDWEKYLHENPL
ncbi:TolC family protein [Nitrosomonas supralitoralis]|uniref:TolC family protein n=1 Tax=Nitrosomonas supralitoralis TaxID=2116706 RepID=A0A2P7NVR3_9PROT|nr:TolC family protein [Nitrosomonas supralitoralis]PSJ17567.1 TolC family protein [Nitrosomonas supralitoralis]